MLQTSLHPHLLEAGCDEAGRGCLAGPVFAAAVILPSTFEHPLLNDSKKIAEPTRILLKEIIEKEAISYAVEMVLPKEIDKINILNASILAMHLALSKLKIKPEFVLVDGNRFKQYRDISHQCIVKGDGKYANIAAASILAKTYRDEYMMKMHPQFPYYNWNQNKGYPTVKHRQAILKYGSSKHHRMSFQVSPPKLTSLF